MYKLENKKPEVEEKSKKIYKLNEDTYFMCFKPHLRSITSNREENIEGTEHQRLLANMYFMKLLESNGIRTQIKDNKIHNIEEKEGILVKKIKTIPIEFICRYYAAGSIVRLYPSLVKEGQKFKTPLYKFDLKQDIKITGVDDPTLNENYIVGLEILTKQEFKKAKAILASVGEIIRKDLYKNGMKLIDMKIELGFDENNQIVVIDEISQDCIRANDIITGNSLTKDAFRQLKSDKEVLNCYEEFNRRLGINYSKKSIERYKLYEYLRDNDNITADMSNTKMMIVKLMENDRKMKAFCNKKLKEEKKEYEDAKIGKHFHENMPKREILINEISQYIYWLTIIAIAKNVKYENSNIENTIFQILKEIDITAIGESKPITIDEIIQHDLKQLEKKNYLKEVIKK